MDLTWIAAAVTFANTVRVVFYAPQILAVIRSVDGARDIALSTWALWTLTNALGAAYGVWVVREPMLATSFALCTAAYATTVMVTVVKRLRFDALRRCPSIARPATGRR